MRPTLGAMSKYPRPSLPLVHPFDSSIVAEKKPGYFQNDRLLAWKAFRGLELRENKPGVFSRHPLAFLTEAADDVCYAIADLEAAFKLGIISFADTQGVMMPLAQHDSGFEDMTTLTTTPG